LCDSRAALVPALGVVDDVDHEQHDGHLDEPTTVARAAPELKPNRLMAAATASSKKLDAPIKADGQAMLCFSPTARLSQ
jgi:hypothetical protein